MNRKLVPVQTKKNEFLDYEQLENGRLYAFTFNPQQQPILTDPLGIKDWYICLREFFFSLKGCRIQMYVEVSKYGRWHFHGYLKIINRLQFTIYSAPRLIERGASKVDLMRTTDDYMKWRVYCYKQQNEMQDLLTREIYCEIDPRVLTSRNPDGVIAISNI